MSDHLDRAGAEMPWATSALRALVQAESPSTDRQALEACAVVLAALCADCGAEVSRAPGHPTADHVVARWPGERGRVLLLGHFDTVWPVGQVDRMPIVIADGRMTGPGVLDMKAGLVVAMTAVRVAIDRLGPGERPAVTLLATSDEEVGSATSRALIESLALESDAVLVFEPAIPGGALKTSRKGVGEFEITAHGISSHAGADPGAGASAVHELAGQILRVAGLAVPADGRSVNVGVIEGGTRSNVVAETARAFVDVRVSRLSDASEVEAAMAALRAVNPRVRLDVRGGINRPPMERTSGVGRLFALAKEVAAAWGEDLEEGGTGGASDGNFTAALGVPTLDGLGGVGDGPHALHEHVMMDFLPRRVALVAGLIERLAAGDGGSGGGERT